MLRRTQHIVKAHIARNRTVIEKDINIAVSAVRIPARQVTAVRSIGINLAAPDFVPLRVWLVNGGDHSAPLHLRWRENGELEALIHQRFQSGIIHRRFRQPNAFGLTPKPRHKVSFAPTNLGLFVTIARQGHDDVVVYLGDRIPVTRKAIAAFAIGL
jgi:hypothetical protein